MSGFQGLTKLKKNLSHRARHPMGYKRSEGSDIACNDVVKGCAFKATGTTEEELLAKIEKHARESHGVEEITPELAAKVKSAIKDH